MEVPDPLEHRIELAAAADCLGMNEKSENEKPAHQKPVNKATMDQPQEEFVAPDSSHADPNEKQDAETVKKLPTGNDDA